MFLLSLRINKDVIKIGDAETVGISTQGVVDITLKVAGEFVRPIGSTKNS